MEDHTMNKRHFLTAAMLGGPALAPAARAQGAPARSAAPALLTVTGAIGKGNRGGVDADLDQMMVKQKIAFGKAHVFDFAVRTALPAVTIFAQCPWGPYHIDLPKA
jgi:hypothetical protein